jgi:hypothetical protein
MTDKPDTTSLVERALEIKAKLRTPEQAKRREQVDERNRQIQAGVERGSNMHPDRTFGKVAKS